MIIKKIGVRREMSTDFASQKVKKSFCQKVILSFLRVDYHEGWGNANPNANAKNYGTPLRVVG